MARKPKWGPGIIEAGGNLYHYHSHWYKKSDAQRVAASLRQRGQLARVRERYNDIINRNTWWVYQWPAKR